MDPKTYSFLSPIILTFLGFTIGANIRHYRDTIFDFTEGSYRDVKDYQKYEKDLKKDLSRSLYWKIMFHLAFPGRALAYRDLSKKFR